MLPYLLYILKLKDIYNKQQPYSNKVFVTLPKSSFTQLAVIALRNRVN